MSSTLSSGLPPPHPPKSQGEPKHFQVQSVHRCPQANCLELFNSLDAVLSHRLLKLHWSPASSLYHLCIWPGCTFIASYRYQIRNHIRRIHYGHRMARTVDEKVLSSEALKVRGKVVRQFSAPDDFIISSSCGNSAGFQINFLPSP